MKDIYDSPIYELIYYPDESNAPSTGIFITSAVVALWRRGNRWDETDHGFAAVRRKDNHYPFTIGMFAVFTKFVEHMQCYDEDQRANLSDEWVIKKLHQILDKLFEEYSKLDTENE